MNIVKNDPKPPRPRGRPRGFDRDEALGCAAETFWRLGYEGASIPDLTEAMGITPQSLYAAFTCKADLYREALDWHHGHFGAATARALEKEPHVAAALARLLRQAAHDFAQAGRPRGCMVSTALLACAEEHEAVARHAAGLRTETLARIRERIEKGVRDGQLLPETDAEALARFVGAMIQGMSVQARDGASETALKGLAEHAVAEVARHKT